MSNSYSYLKRNSIYMKYNPQMCHLCKSNNYDGIDNTNFFNQQYYYQNIFQNTGTNQSVVQYFYLKKYSNHNKCNYRNYFPDINNSFDDILNTRISHYQNIFRYKYIDFKSLNYYDLKINHMIDRNLKNYSSN